METVMAVDNAGGFEDTISSVSPVLAQYPDSYETWCAMFLLEERLGTATPVQLSHPAASLMNGGAPVTPTEGLATCRVVAAHARTAGALEACNYVAVASGALLTL